MSNVLDVEREVKDVRINKKIRKFDRITKEDLIPRKYRIINARELGSILGIQEVVVKAYKDAQIIEYARNLDGDLLPHRYDMYDCIQRIFVHERGHRRSLKNSVTHVHGQMELAKLHAQKVKTEREVIQNQIFFSSLFRKDDVIKTWNDMVLAIRSHIMGLTWTVVPKIIGKSDLKEVMEIHEKETEKMMDDLSKMDDKMLEQILEANKKDHKIRENLKNSGYLPDTRKREDEERAYGG